MKKATSYTPTALHISAEEGQPSTFWKSQSGKYYRTKAEAEKDSGKAVNPEDYRIDLSFFSKYKTYILGAFVAAVITAAIIYFAPKITAKFGK